MKADDSRLSGDEPGQEEQHQVAWSPFSQDLAATLWPSFLAASLATMFFFAFVDPSVFAEGAVTPHWPEGRMAGYALGFFFFWAICTLSSALTLYLARTATPRRPRAGR